jgi:hypothetical protein
MVEGVVGSLGGRLQRCDGVEDGRLQLVVVPAVLVRRYLPIEQY